MKLHKMTPKELDNYRQYCVQAGNTLALAEINDFKKFYGKIVEVIGGKKNSERCKRSRFLRRKITLWVSVVEGVVNKNRLQNRRRTSILHK